MADRPPTYAEVRERRDRALEARPGVMRWFFFGLLGLVAAALGVVWLVARS